MPAAVSRLRLLDWMLSRGPATVGICQGDVQAAAQIINASQERLIYARETGDAGFWGTWAEMVFQPSRSSPYITTPRGVARIEWMTACSSSIPIQNRFYEYLRFGFGKVPPVSDCCDLGCRPLQAYERGLTPTFTDLTPGSRLRLYPGSAADLGKKLLASGTDSNNQPVTNLNNDVVVDGEMATFALPFVDLLTPWNKLTGLQKDVTEGPLSIYEFDMLGNQTLLLTMEPGETVAGYTRYYLDALPANCCCGTVEGTVQVDALVKLDLVPVRVATDYLLFQSLEALTAEAQSIRLSEIDGGGPKTESAERHRSAIRLLQGQLAHQMGRQTPAIQFAPWGSARLERQGIGTMV